MRITYRLPSEEINTLEQIIKNHEDPSTRQRAGLILLSSVNRRPDRGFSPIGLSVLLERYRQFGFFCLLPLWERMQMKATTV